MRNFWLTILLALIASLVYGQGNFDQEAISKLSDDTCSCIAKKDNIDSASVAEMELGRCIITSYGKDKAYYQSVGLNFTETNAAEKIGIAVGMNLAMNCGAFLDIFMNFELEDDEQSIEDDDQSIEDEGLYTLTGQLLSIKSDTFNELTVQDTNGRQHKVLWLTYVHNGTLLDQAVQDNKTYTFVVKELDIYDPRIDDYRNRYVLQSIEN